MVDKIKISGIGDRIVEFWDMGYSGDKIAEMTGSVVTGRSILRFLNRSGIQTSDTRKDAVCALPSCGILFKKVRSVFLRARKHYCCKEHYWRHLENPEYIRSVYGMRMARKAVRDCGYYIIEGEVVHHKDGDCNNNDPNNLMVFACQGDYNRWHRGDRSLVTPLWGGVPGKPPAKEKVVRGDVIADLKEAILRPGKPEACVECRAPAGHRAGCSLGGA